ncbi:MAG: isochorismatase family protein [Betaproteobacteria bacterium]|nr:isochorismatase family protein [Betaproteobacteria bacterium]
MRVTLGSGDALLVVDVQYDFLPGGRLAVPEGDGVVAPLNRYIAAFTARRLPVYASRDWHPENHCSFRARGGPWPQHCVAGSDGAQFAAGLALPPGAVVIDKGAAAEKEAYSAFEGTGFARRLRRDNVTRLLIGGLATDYCVLNTVRDALAARFSVLLLKDAIRAVDVNPGDGERAEREMQRLGAEPIVFEDIAP